MWHILFSARTAAREQRLDMPPNLTVTNFQLLLRINRIIAMVRAKVEHPFRILKRQFGHVKTRYRGLAKNRAQLFTLFALGNLFLVRGKLLA